MDSTHPAATIRPGLMEPWRSSSRDSTFHIKFRRRRRRLGALLSLIPSSLTFICVIHLLLALIISSVYCNPLIHLNQAAQSQSIPSVQSSCDIGYCFSGQSGGISNLASMSCPQLKSLHGCLKGLRTEVTGGCMIDLNFHTLATMVKNMRRKTCRKADGRDAEPTSSSSRQIQHSPPVVHHRSQPEPPATPTVRSGDSSASKQNQLLPNDAMKRWRDEQYCLSAAYNFTIGEAILEKRLFDALLKHLSSVTVANAEEHKNLYKPHQFESLPDHDQQRSSTLPSFNHFPLKFDDDASSPVDHHHQQSSSYSNTQSDSELKRKRRKERPKRETITSPPKSMVYRPVQPRTPSLTCIIFGDPHIRTFDSRYQTCNCVGARSLIEHPLFDVQITNTRLSQHFNTTGVTRVTVIIRQFAHCSIPSAIEYETNSLTQSKPNATFKDGSTYINQWIWIKPSSANDSVITINLGHIGARVYISQWHETPFLNVVVKFLTASSTVKHSAVVKAISPLSLCKSGCHPRELIDLETVLKSAGVDTRHVPGTVIGADDEDEPNSASSAEHYNEGGDESGQSNGEDESYAVDEEDGQNGDEYEEEEDEEGEDEDETDDGDQHQAQVPPRGKRIRKDSPSDEPDEFEQPKPKDRKRNRNRNRDRKNKQPKTPNDPDAAQKAALASFAALRPGATKSSSAEPQPHYPPPQSLHQPEPVPVQEVQEQLKLPQIIPQANIQPMQPTLTDECNQLKDYFRLACLHDTLLLNISTHVPYQYAASFDEARLPELAPPPSTPVQPVIVGAPTVPSLSPSSAITSSPTNILLMISLVMMIIHLRLNVITTL